MVDDLQGYFSVALAVIQLDLSGASQGKVVTVGEPVQDVATIRFRRAHASWRS
jgi:hypothetical protein